MSITTPAPVPRAIRLPEVEVAVFTALDERGIKPGQTIPFVEIEVTMDARGYSFRWVRRAVDSLIGKGALRLAGPSMIERLDLTPAPGRRGRHYRISHRRRSTLAKL